jgi:hypothetical protein
MNPSQWAVSLTGSGKPLYFASVNIVDGSLAQARANHVEELRAPGVDGSRFRTRGKHAKPLILRLATSTDEYETLETLLYNIVGRPITCTVKVGGKTHIFPKATVTEEPVILSRGQKLTGFGEVDSETRSLEVRLVIARPNLQSDESND